MEKFITLDHLKKAVQSLILDTDSKINGLPTAARTGDYNDLTNKPSENLTPYGYLEYENGYYRLYTNADKILQKTGASFIEFPVFLNGINNYEYVNNWENYLYLNDAATANYKIAFERKSELREDGWRPITSSEYWDKDFEKYFGTTSNFFSCHLGELPDGYGNNGNNLVDTLYIQNYKPFQKNEIPYIYHHSVSHYNTTNDTHEYVGQAFYKEITSDYQFKYPITGTDIVYNHNQLVNIVQPDGENAFAINECILCIPYSDYTYGSGFTYKFCPIDNTIDYYWEAHFPYNAQNSLDSWKYFDDNGAIIFQTVYEEKTIPDWNENNSTADDYIQNRTHYEEEVSDYTWCEDLEFSVATGTSTSIQFFDLNTTDISYGSCFKPNTSYTVTLDNTDYSLTAYEYKNINTNIVAGIAIGNSSLLLTTVSPADENVHDNTVPFIIYRSYTSAIPQQFTFRRDSNSILNNTNHTITIKGYATVAHKIDNKYLNGKLIGYGSGTNAEILNSKDNIASGLYSHAEGYSTEASGVHSHAEGYFTAAKNQATHTEGYCTVANGSNGHAEGFKTIAKNQGSHAEGIITRAGQNMDDIHGSHTEGYATFASGIGAHAEGRYGSWSNKKVTKQAGSLVCTLNDPTACSCPIDGQVTINNVWIYLQFYSTGANSLYPISNLTITDGYLRDFTLDLSQHNLSKGLVTSITNSETTNGNVSIFVGSMANGHGAHAEGGYTFALDTCAHAEGWHTMANANSSHAEGDNTIASSANQHVQGKYNIIDSNNTYLDIVGNGTAHDARSNAYTLDWSGNGVYAGKVTVGAAPTANMDVATKLYVDTAMSNVSTDLVGLTDTTISNPTNDQILKYDSTTSKWVNGTLALTTDLTGLTDTAITNPTEGQILSYDNTNSKWINITSPYLTETQVNALIATALAAYGDGDIATYGYDDGNEVSY